MANTVTYTKLWDPVVLSTAQTEIYVGETVTTTGVIKNISAVLCNTGSTGAKVSIWVIPSGSAAGSSNQLMNETIVPAYDSLEVTIPDMRKNDTLSGLSDTGTVTIHCNSGIPIN